MSEFITTAPREEQDRKGTIRTYTGRYVKPLAMTLEDICIEDIAHHLAGEPRFCSATPGEPYPVAQHSCYVAYFFDEPFMQLGALLHDAPEAYLKDIPSPVKHDPRFDFYREIDSQLLDLIYEKVGISISEVNWDRIKDVDDTVFGAESRFFFGGNYTPGLVWTHWQAEQHFLADFYKYSNALRNLEAI